MYCLYCAAELDTGGLHCGDPVSDQYNNGAADEWDDYYGNHVVIYHRWNNNGAADEWDDYCNHVVNCHRWNNHGADNNRAHYGEHHILLAHIVLYTYHQTHNQTQHIARCKFYHDDYF